MHETVNFKNLDEKQEQILQQVLNSSFEGLKLNYHANFERSKAGIFKGTVLALNSEGPVFVSGANFKFSELCAHISLNLNIQMKKKTHAQKGTKNETGEYSNPIERPAYKESKSDFYNDKKSQLGSTEQKTKILIVDDDVDALNPIYSAFVAQNCDVKRALNHIDAFEQIQQGPIDILILDWQLGATNGGDLIDRCLLNIENSTFLQKKISKSPVKVVTYSSELRKDIFFADGFNGYFFHHDHWKKPLRYKDLEQKVQSLLKESDN